MRCSVNVCSNNSRSRGEGISFHRFPSDEPRRSLWIRYIGLDDSDILKNSVICSEHFMEKDIIRLSSSTCLGENAVPVLKLTQEKSVPPITKSATCERLTSQQTDSIHQIAARQMLKSASKPIFSGVFLCDTTPKVDVRQELWTSEVPVHTEEPTEFVFTTSPTIMIPQNNSFISNDTIIELQPFPMPVENNSMATLSIAEEVKNIADTKEECIPQKPPLEPITIIKPDPAQTMLIYKLESRLNTVQNKLKVKNQMIKKSKQRIKRLEERLSREKILIDFQKEKLRELESGSKEVERLQKENFKLKKILNLVPKDGEEQNCSVNDSNTVKTTISKMTSRQNESGSAEIERLQKENFNLRKILNLLPKNSKEQNCSVNDSNKTKMKSRQNESGPKEVERLQKENFNLKKILNLVQKNSEEQNCSVNDSNTVTMTMSKTVS